MSVDRDELDELSVSRLVLVLTEQLELLELELWVQLVELVVQVVLVRLDMLEA